MLDPCGPTLDDRNGTTALILVDHGSKQRAANEMLVHVVDLFRRVSGLKIVQAAHMDLAEPTLDQAFDACVGQGATAVVVHPYFLAPGRHSTLDIPRMVAAAAARHPGIQYHVTPPLGLDEKITHIIMDRVSQCLKASLDCQSCPDQGCRQAKERAQANAEKGL